MEGLIVLMVLMVVFAPITLSIIAIVKVSGMRDDLRRMREEWHSLQRRPEAPPAIPPPPRAEPERASAPVKVPVRPAAAPPPRQAPAPVPRPARPKAGVEFLMGGKAAAFAGIAILVMGIVFLVGYAIQHAWIGPGTRIVLGLVSGGVLVLFGDRLRSRDEKYSLLAQVLIGGGSALFYFCVFAAYGIYHLIGALPAGIGLFASALAVFGLAMAYRSQAIALLGVAGAFIAPLLIGGDMESGTFPLAYVALVNVPVLLLGVRRRWQLLYNTAFVFTVLHYLVWVGWVAVSEFWTGLGFALLFHAEYAALGLLKLRSEQRVAGRTADLVRLVSASVLLLGAVHWLFDEVGRGAWTGSAFLLIALAHAGLARFAFRILARFNGEILAFLAGGLIFATMALPVQLDGEWVSLGWAVEGAAVAWFASRVQSRILQAGALLLGLIGIMKALLFDVSLHPCHPRLFLNARFMVGFGSAALLGVQGKLASRFPDRETATRWQDVLWWAAVLGAVLVFFADAFWTLGAGDAYCWLITSIMLLATGAAVVLLAPSSSSVVKLGGLLLLAVPVKLLFDALAGPEIGNYHLEPFHNAAIWIGLLLVVLAVVLLGPRIAARPGLPLPFPAEAYARMLNMASLAAGIGLLTIEILRKPDDWANMAATILWAVCALALILFGMKRRSAAHRYFGLVLFGLAAAKVLLIDSSELRGLERIAAFIGTGVLLLVLSFAYQKASAFFHQQGEGQ